MSDQQAFFHLLDILEAEERVDPTRFFDQMRGSFKITNLLYVHARAGSGGFRLHRLLHTYGKTAIEAYVRSELDRIDPGFPALIGNLRPMDWNAGHRPGPAARPLFAEAPGVPAGCIGLTLPLSSPPRRLAFLAIQSDVPAEQWQAYRRCHLRDFQLLANLFHASLLETEAALPLKDDGGLLTQRETEVLGWAAAGKSYWEIGAILGISERTVRFFMTNARHKLNVVSNTQAVAQAVRRDLIQPV